jgi:hypothetical protein
MTHRPTPPSDAETARAISAMEYEPLLPVEKTLIAVSLTLGIVLLGVLYWISTTYFPIGPPPAGP